MPDKPQPAYANPKFARAYLRVSAKAEERGVREHRRALLAGLAGMVCEVGAGQRLNFAHYPNAVTRVLAVEPEPTLRRHALDAAARAPIPVEVLDGAADALPLDDASCNAVVTSLVLCTVPDLPDALAEVRRVLRPGGDLRFYEHVRSALRPIAIAEDLVTPMWSRFAGGCHPNRDSVAAITAAGFDVSSVDRFGFSAQRGVPRTAHVLGRATRG
jgi:ubiquinone/menaquinone biosynthesis C-methylase UbiE